MLKSQYHAALTMLRDAIEQCPDAEWVSRHHKNAFWQVAYHVLFFTHLYLQQNETTFVLWSQHHGDDDGTRGEPYSRAQVLEYWSFVDQAVDGGFARSRKPGEWIPVVQHVQARASAGQHPPRPASWRATG